MRFESHQCHTPDPMKLMSSTKFEIMFPPHLRLVSWGLHVWGVQLWRMIHAIWTMATLSCMKPYLLLGLGWCLLYDILILDTIYSKSFI